jgi:hypothetical protein
MLKKYRVVSLGKRDSFFHRGQIFTGLELLADSADIGTCYNGALSGCTLFPLPLKDEKNVIFTGGVRCFHELYVEEI